MITTTTTMIRIPPPAAPALQELIKYYFGLKYVPAMMGSGKPPAADAAGPPGVPVTSALVVCVVVAEMNICLDGVGIWELRN